MSAPRRQTLVLRFADVGVATYASLRVVGQPSRTVTWVVEEPTLVAALERLATALPDPHGSESQRDAVERAIATGPFASPPAELDIARDLASQLLAAPAWQLVTECVASPRAALFISPAVGGPKFVTGKKVVTTINKKTTATQIRSTGSRTPGGTFDANASTSLLASPLCMEAARKRPCS